MIEERKIGAEASEGMALSEYAPRTSTGGQGRAWLRILLISLLLGLVAYAASFLVHPRYQAVATLYFPLSNEEGSSPLDALKGAGSSSDPGSIRFLGGALSSPNVGSSKQTAIGILNSNTCVEAAVRRLNLTDEYHQPLDKAVKTLHSRLQTTIDKNGLLVVDVNDERPERAVAIIQALSNKLLEMSSSLSLNVSSRNAQFIRTRVVEARRQFNIAKARLANGIAGMPLANVEDIQRRRNELANEATSTRVKILAARAQISKTESQLKAILSQTNTFPGRIIALDDLYKSLDALTKELESRRLSLADTAREYKLASPSLRAALGSESTASTVASEILNRRKAVVNQGLEPSLLGAKASLSALDVTAAQYDKITNRLDSSIRSATNQYMEMQTRRRDFTAAQERLNTYERELEAAQIAELRDPSRFEVIDPAQPTGELVYPRRVVTAAVVFCLAIVIQLLPALFFTRSNR